MKKVIITLFCFTVLLSCKNDKKTEANENTIAKDVDGKSDKQSDGLTLLKGGFVYYGDAAVLQTPRDVYAVIVDTKMHELNDMAAKYKKEPTDMVPVEIRGKIIPKPENEEGWAFRIKVEEILNVSEPSPESNDVIKLEQ
jgi:hypothetical protein